MGLFGTLRFWRVRSRWDYLAFFGVIQWLAVAPIAAGYGLVGLGIGESGYLVAGVGLLLLLGMNALSWTVALAAHFGAEAHPHLEPDGIYSLAGLFFGPLVGPHYLWRTGQGD